MPFEIRLDATKRIARTRVWGQLTDAELLAHRERIQALFDRRELDDRWAQIVDFMEVTGFVGVSSDGVRSMAERNPWPATAIRVIVAPTDEAFGLARMYQLFRHIEQVRVTRSLTDAEALVARLRS